MVVPFPPHNTGLTVKCECRPKKKRKIVTACRLTRQAYPHRHVRSTSWTEVRANHGTFDWLWLAVIELRRKGPAVQGSNSKFMNAEIPGPTGPVWSTLIKAGMYTQMLDLLPTYRHQTPVPRHTTLKSGRSKHSFYQNLFDYFTFCHNSNPKHWDNTTLYLKCETPLLVLVEE